MKLRYFILLLGFSGLAACTDPPPPSLNSKDREQIDSLYKLEVKALKEETDSLCATKHDSLLQVITDSIMSLRRAEIERQLQRIRQLEQQ